MRNITTNLPFFIYQWSLKLWLWPNRAKPAKQSETKPNRVKCGQTGMNGALRVQMGPKGSKRSQTEPNWSKQSQTGPNGTKWVQSEPNGSKQSQTGPNRSKRIKRLKKNDFGLEKFLGQKNFGSNNFGS